MATIADFAIDPKTNFQMDYSSIIVPTDQLTPTPTLTLTLPLTLTLTPNP